MTESEARRKLENEGYALQVKRNHPDISNGMEKPTVIHPTIPKEAIVKKIKEIINNEKVNLTNEEITELFDNISDYDESFGDAIEQLLDEVNAINDIWKHVPITSLYQEIISELKSWVCDVYKSANPNMNEDFIHDVAADDYVDISISICDGHTYLTTAEWKEILLAAPKK